MNHPEEPKDFRNWYSNENDSSSATALLDRTVTHAKAQLAILLTPKDYARLFIPTPPPSFTTTTTTTTTTSSSTTNPTEISPHDIFDVQQSLQDAQAAYESRTGMGAAEATTTMTTVTALGRSKLKARQWLTGLSEKLVHYGNIFDVLVQHHPEYVSLAWGTFKLLFVAITNHADTAAKLSRSISQIADLLPQHSLHLILYPTPQMQNTVAKLYAHILHFFLSALKWYKDNAAVHAIKAIFQPWDLKFRHEYENIAAESQRIGRLADVALKAEVRDTRLEVVQGTKLFETMRDEMRELRAENRQLVNFLEKRFGMMEDSMACMVGEIRVDFDSQRAVLNRVHLNQMLSLPFWNSLPTSGESLRFCRSMRDRRRERTRLPLPDVQKLETWATQKNTAVLLIDTHMPLIAKNFMVDLIDLVLDNQLPIIWALRFPDYWDHRTSTTDVLRMLLLQAMQLGADKLLDGPFPVTVEQLREATSLRDWIVILNRLLSRISHAFIVLDADLLAHATAFSRGEALEMLDMLRLDLSSNVKIVTATSSVSRAYAEELEQSDACVKIQTGNPPRLRKPRRPRRAMMRRRKS